MVREAIRELRGSPSPGCSACWPGGSRRGRRLIGSLIGLTDEQFNRETGPGAAALPRRGQARAVSSRTRWRPSRPIRPLGWKRP